MDSTKAINKSTENISNDGFIDYIYKNKTNLLRISALLIIIGSIIGIITYHSSLDTGESPEVEQAPEENEPQLPILDPQFGTNYSGGGGLDTLYDNLGGNDPLNNATLEAEIRVDTDQYSCKFNVNYDGPDNKKVECSDGCFSDDENSKFCESYIYTEEKDGGKTLETLYDDAGGNEGGRRFPAQYTANINVSAGYDFNNNEDTSCGFYVEYEGNNKRTVTCNNTDCPDKCKSYEYINRHQNGDNGDVLLDATYISRRESSIDEPCQYCNENQKCVNDECVCIDGYEGEYCQKRSTGTSDSQGQSEVSASNSDLVLFSIGYVIFLSCVIFLALLLSYDNDIIVMPSILIFGLYTILMGNASKDWNWLIVLWISEVLIGIITLINIFGGGGEWVKIFQVVFIVFYIVNYFIMNNLV